MKGTILISSILAFVIFACQLSNVESGQLYIRGRLFLTDTIFQHVKDQVLAKKIILLRQGTDTTNFLYSTESDTAGYFVFQLAKPADNYKLKYEETINGIIYSAFLVVKDNQQALMEAKLDNKKQNGFYVYCRDTQGGYIPNALVTIYNSEILAKLNDPSGAFKTITADASGLAAMVNLPAGQYYLNATKILTGKKDTLKRIAKLTTIDVTGIKAVDSLTLK